MTRDAASWEQELVHPGDDEWWAQLHADVAALLTDRPGEPGLRAALASPGVLRRLAVAVGDRLPVDTDAVTSEPALAPLATAVSLRTGLPVVVDGARGQTVATIVEHGGGEREVGVWDVVAPPPMRASR